MGAYEIFKGMDDKRTEETIESMRSFAIDHGLYEAFMEEIVQSPRFDRWVMNDALVERFGWFVLEHAADMK
jgi:hypothetical protein